MKAEALVASTQIEVQRTGRDLDAARNRLAATWGSRIAEFDRLEGSLNAFPLPDLVALKEKLLQSPEILGSDAAILEGKGALKMEKAKVIPNVLVTGGYRQFEFTNDHAFVIGASVPLPIFDRNRGAIAEAENRLAAAGHKKTLTEVRLNLELKTAYQKAATAEAEIRSLESLVLPATQAVLDATLEGYRLGKFGYLEVLDAQRTMANTRLQYLTALTEFHLAVADRSFLA